MKRIEWCGPQIRPSHTPTRLETAASLLVDAVFYSSMREVSGSVVPTSQSNAASKTNKQTNKRDMIRLHCSFPHHTGQQRSRMQSVFSVLTRRRTKDARTLSSATSLCSGRDDFPELASLSAGRQMALWEM